MIHFVDEALHRLLQTEGPELLRKIAISFRAPDRDFAKNVPPPAINVFLYDIRENLDLRNNESFITYRNNGKATLEAAPVRVDCSYLITAWSNADDAPREEHRFLGEVMRTLLRFPELPEQYLRGDLAKPGLPLPAAVLHPGRLQSLGEFWQALDGQPRTALNYTVTIAVQPGAPVESDLVTGINTEIDTQGADRG